MNSFRCFALLLLSVLLGWADITFSSPLPSSEWRRISDHRSVIFKSEQAEADCQRARIEVITAFQRPLVSQLGFELVAAECGVVRNSARQLVIAHEHPIAEEMSTLFVDTFENETACVRALPDLRERLAMASLPAVFDRCDGTTARLEVVDPIAVKLSSVQSPLEMPSLEECLSSATATAVKLEEAGFTVLASGCRSSDEGFDFEVHLASEPGLRVARMAGQVHSSLAACEAGASNQAERLSGRGVAVISDFCSRINDTQYRESFQIVTHVLQALRVKTGTRVASMEECESTRAEVVSRLEQNYEVLLSYCSQASRLNTHVDTFIYGVHYRRRRSGRNSPRVLPDEDIGPHF